MLSGLLLAEKDARILVLSILRSIDFKYFSCINWQVMDLIFPRPRRIRRRTVQCNKYSRKELYCHITLFQEMNLLLIQHHFLGGKKISSSPKCFFDQAALRDLAPQNPYEQH